MTSEITSEITEYEYSPCIRKGKQSKKQKKQKKYEPKAQKRNLNQTRRHKIINAQIDALNDSKDSLTELMEILNTENILKWNSNYDQLYKEYELEEIEELKRGYLNIQHKLCEEYWNKLYEESLVC